MLSIWVPGCTWNAIQKMIIKNIYIFLPIDENSFKTIIVANHYNLLGPKTEASKQNTTTKIKTKFMNDDVQNK